MVRSRFSRSALVLCAVLAVACSTSREATPAGAQGKPNLLLITIDTTRADHLRCYGAARAETPRLDAIAKEGMLVTQAIATAPLTFPSHCSILTGLYPPKHGVRDNADFELTASQTTLAEHLKSLGYSTHAVVAAFVLSGSLGLTQGFDSYDEPPAKRPAGAPVDPGISARERRAATVTDAAIRALDTTGGKPFFLWAHYYDPHFPYAPPEPFAKRFADRPYDGEIAYMDAEIGRLLDALAKRGSLDRTLVLVVGDHGEGLGEHGEATHGVFVYDSAIHVPLLLRFPGVVPAGRKADRVVSTADIVPTVLDLLGLPQLSGVEGASFAAAAKGAKDARKEPVYAESLYPEHAYGWAPLYALRDASTKFIEAPSPELYDVASDPGEKKNLAPSRGKDVPLWRGRLQAAVKAFGAADPGAASPMDQEAHDQLASLGYVSGGAKELHRTGKPDPKDLIEVNEKFNRAMALNVEKKPMEALKLLGEALALDPENAPAMSLSGRLTFFAAGDHERGLKQLEAASKLASGVLEVERNLGEAAMIAGKYPVAVEAYRKCLAMDPEPETHYRLGKALQATNDPAGALREYDEAAKGGYKTPDLRASQGIALVAVGNRAGGEAALKEAVAADPNLPDAWNKLGILAAQSGKNEEARDLFGRALAANPDHADALYNHAKASMMLKDAATAEKDVARLAEKHPEYPSTWFLQAHLLIARGEKDKAKAIVKDFLAKSQNADPKLVASAQDLLKKLGGS